uniref:Uncharacterized protein n=1 Tax=Arundo donax TaxID=35708 RepID=A0A0A9B6N6_ARUDO
MPMTWFSASLTLNLNLMVHLELCTMTL